MADSFTYKTYEIHGDGTSVREKISELFTERGYIRTGESGSACLFRYPSILFSSKKPLTCISRLSLDVTERNGRSRVTIGVTFTKIRYFTIALIVLICIGIPVLISFVQYGINRLPDIPPMAYLGLPLGFMLHYHVRWRVFRAVKRLVESAGEPKNSKS